MAEVRKDINIRISHNEMEAFLTLTPLPEGEDYTKMEVMSALAEKGVKYGIEESLIDALIEGREYGKEVMVARGKLPVDGVDGFFQFNFNMDFSGKPKVRPDGSVDYWSIHAVETVEEGQVIAVYHEPIFGENGMDVHGKVLTCKRGRPLSPLTGKGFERSEDNKIYTASITGKIDYNNNRIQILPIYEIYGNVDLTTGNIDFRGDVLVHGNVTSGTSIKATGTVTIDGTAEACNIEAGKDVILRGGFLGGYKGIVRTKGSVTARFMEYATVEAEGYVEATSALNCTIVSHDKIYMTGKSATIVGGNVYATRGIECCCIGNDNEIRTEVSVGVQKETMRKLFEVETLIKKDNEMLEKIVIGLKQFDEIAAERNIDLKNDERRVALLRARISKQADIASHKNELMYLKGLVEMGSGADVRVLQKVCPGVIVGINDCQVLVKEEQQEVRYVLHNGNIVMFSMAGELVG